MKNTDKKIMFLLMLFLFGTLGAIAQTLGFNYQAIIKADSSNSFEFYGETVTLNFLASSDVALRFSILNATGEKEYIEEHYTTTNALGEVNLTVGAGVSSQGDFSDIVWNGTKKQLSVEIDYTANGSSYQYSNTQDLLYLPHPNNSSNTGLISDIKDSIAVVQVNLAQNQTESKAADLALQNTIDILRVDIAANTNKTGITTEESETITSNATALSDLETTVNENKTASETADATLQGNIDGLSTTVTDNKTAHELALTDLGTTVNQNKTASETADATLQGNIDGLSTTVTDNKTAHELALTDLNTKVDVNENELKTTVKSVNGSDPDSSGNVVVSLAAVNTGTLAAKPLTTNAQEKGDMYIVSGDSFENNGRTFISDGEEWREITSNTAATDNRYVNQSGDEMQGNLNLGMNDILNVNDITAVTLNGNLTGNLTATSVLSDGVVATTQNPNNNSTKVATTEYVDQADNGLQSTIDALNNTVSDNKSAHETALTDLNTKVDGNTNELNTTVKVVNGVSPDADGEVVISLPGVETGTFNGKPITVPKEGDMYVVSNDLDGDNNGRTFISDGNIWHEITSNMDATDSRYLNLSGDQMQGTLDMGSQNITNPGMIDGRDVAADGTKLDAIQTGSGLATDGTYTVNSGTNYLDAAGSLDDADDRLDTQIKTNADAITTNTSGVANNSSDIATNATAIALNTDKTGITTEQATAITTNTSGVANNASDIATNTAAIALNTDKTGITTEQATAITTNSSGVTNNASDIATNATAIALNTDKTGITTEQATAITTNTSGVSTNASAIAGIQTDLTSVDNQA
ncbi:MAG: hypothetical protein P8I82_03455, partial [Flavobacteriales bacterium]|nr:hypothetical protein [Flavobacteriales bacterium]